MPHKYNAKPTVVDNLTFDSQLEAARYQQLKLLVAAGEIYDLKVHPVYELEPKMREEWGNEKLNAIKHELDFSYFERGNSRLVVEEIKGMETAVWRLKHNLFLRRFPDIEYRVIKKEDM